MPSNIYLIVCRDGSSYIAPDWSSVLASCDHIFDSGGIPARIVVRKADPDRLPANFNYRPASYDGYID